MTRVNSPIRYGPYPHFAHAHSSVGSSGVLVTTDCFRCDNAFKMNGHLVTGTSIAVDYWKSNCANDYIHFLSHLHADHIVGLNSKWNKPIYTSIVNAKLLLHLYNIKIPSHLVKQLEVGTAHSIEINVNDSICVTLIDANHCPGAVMFLFQGNFGSILYTGDFRYYPNIMQHVPSHIDCLYVDNTCCHPSDDHPSREEALNTILNIVDANSNKTILLGMRKLGKEDLLVRIANHVNSVIETNVEDYRKMQTLGIQHYFTLDKSVTKLKVVPFDSIFKIKYSDDVIRIVPTSLFRRKPTSTNLFIVPYSDHCNFEELKHFIQKVKPRKLFPIVDGKDMTLFHYLIDCSTQCKHSTIRTPINTFAAATSCLRETENVKKRKSIFRTNSLKKLTSVSMRSREIKYFDDEL